MKLTGEGRSVAKLSLGVIFLLFGLNGFLHFMQMPPPADEAGLFLAGLGSAAYFFPLLKGVEVFAGLLLVLNRRVNLALVMLAPIVLNIVLFHLYLDASGLPFGIVLAALLGVACWENKRSLKVLVQDMAS